MAKSSKKSFRRGAINVTFLVFPVRVPSGDADAEATNSRTGPLS
jgi:hypothetical protein